MLSADLQHSDAPCPLPHTGKYTDSLRTTSPIKFPPHIGLFTRIYSTHLRIYASTYVSTFTPQSYAAHRHTSHCRFRCRQHNNTRELNRTDATNNNDFDARGGTKHSIVAEFHVMEGVAGDKLMSNMSDTTTPVLNQHTCVVLTCPLPCLSSINYLCFVQSATKNREHLRWTHGTTSSTPHNGLSPPRIPSSSGQTQAHVLRLQTRSICSRDQSRGMYHHCHILL